MAQNKFRRVAGPLWSTCIICQLHLEDFWCSDNIAVKYTWNNSFLNCGCRCKWRMITAWKKIRASTWFEPVTSALPVRCSTNWAMNFMYTSHHFTPHGRYELNKLTSLPMCGFIAQLVEQRTGNAEVIGSNPVEALIFSGFFFPVALQNLLRWSFFTFSDSITWVFLCIYIIHPMQGHLDFSRSGIAWNWTGADIFVSFLFRQMPELTFLRMLNFFF